MKRSHISNQTRPDYDRPVRFGLRKSGFTLVELLVVITVIGILIGMLVVTIGPLLGRTSEFAIYNESTQLGLSVEKFKNEYGIYPPSFLGINDAPDMLPYLNRIAPNHQEGDGSAGTNLRLWWDEVADRTDGMGIKNVAGADLVFWLSGVFKDKQFPLTGGAMTGGAPQLPVAYNLEFDTSGNPLVDLNGPVGDRQVLYDFQLGRMIPDASGAVLPVSAGYNQPQGKDSVFQYRDSRNYWFDANTNSMFDPFEANAYYDGDVLRSGSGLNPFENPETFQIATYGVDGIPSDPANAEDPLDWTKMDKESRDNITNFSEGILEKMNIQ